MCDCEWYPNGPGLRYTTMIGLQGILECVAVRVLRSQTWQAPNTQCLRRSTALGLFSDPIHRMMCSRPLSRAIKSVTGSSISVTHNLRDKELQGVAVVFRPSRSSHSQPGSIHYHRWSHSRPSGRTKRAPQSLRIGDFLNPVLVPEGTAEVDTRADRFMFFLTHRPVYSLVPFRQPNDGPR